MQSAYSAFSLAVPFPCGQAATHAVVAFTCAALGSGACDGQSMLLALGWKKRTYGNTLGPARDVARIAGSEARGDGRLVRGLGRAEAVGRRGHKGSGSRRRRGGLGRGKGSKEADESGRETHGDGMVLWTRGVYCILLER
ncbi:hypothetical protein CMQ_3932 [Grosmannia clavigera kw1407]|uniref:Uncharacterized protein n=1 Tax=Grosmannia clavigera (strain kw1407 / UAMH 11150) TaxID=655863 RepID=F0X9G7_GROCL|nr:uncharacterized protein CMQ_3932 [Grosmannia clavigera kw1407]EFX05863.1 hypothetical protein CMQ_3932 [Grosmannia clavigera kw1407]